MIDNVIRFPTPPAIPANAPACTVCALNEKCVGQVLRGTGPERARIMLVGEAPGYDEARLGAPFVGKAGQMLDRLLAKARIERDACFVTNAVRCAPEGKLKPDVKAINACKHYLRAEIERVQPELIVALGNYPLRSLTGNSGITKFRGTLQHLNVKKGAFAGLPTIPIMPTWHPAYILREPAHEHEAVTDLTSALRHLDGGFAQIETSWHWYQDAGVPNMDSPLWSWDIETNGRELHDPDLVVWFFSIDDGARVTMFGPGYVQDGVDCLRRYAERGGNLAGHNASGFDRPIIEKLFGFNAKTHDTQLLAHLIDEEQSLRLDHLCVRYLGVEPWKDFIEGDVTTFWRNWAAATEEQKNASYDYNAKDTRYTHRLFQVLWDIADERTRRLYVKHSLPCSRALAAMEARGVWLSKENIESAYAEIEVEQQIALIHLKDLVRPDFNPASHQQVREVLFSDLLLPVQGETNAGDPSTDVEALKRLQSIGIGGPVLSSVLKHRKNSKLLGYLRGYGDRLAASPTGFIYPSYSMSATVNYRTSAFSPNLQNVPRDKRVRSSVAAPPGFKLLEADASQFELRQAADLAGPQSALFQEYLKPKPDVHRQMAARIMDKLPEQVTSEERSDAKPANFAFLYYADEETYIRQALTEFDRVVPWDEAHKAKEAFRAWGVDGWWARTIEELEENGEVVSVLGAVRRLPAIYSKDKYARLEAKRMAINFTDASVTSHLFLLFLAEVTGLGFHPCAYIHDALHLLVPDDEEEIARTTAALTTAFEATVPDLAEQLFGYRPRVPLKLDVSVGRWWGDK